MGDGKIERPTAGIGIDVPVAVQGFDAPFTARIRDRLIGENQHRARAGADSLPVPRSIFPGFRKRLGVQLKCRKWERDLELLVFETRSEGQDLGGYTAPIRVPCANHRLVATEMEP